MGIALHPVTLDEGVCNQFQQRSEGCHIAGIGSLERGIGQVVARHIDWVDHMHRRLTLCNGQWFAREPRLLVLTKANSRATVHRPGYLDYIGVKKFDAEGRSSGPGTVAARSLAMGHVVLTVFFVHQKTPFFDDYVRTFTDLPFLVTLDQGADGTATPVNRNVARVTGLPLASRTRP